MADSPSKVSATPTQPQKKQGCSCLAGCFGLVLIIIVPLSAISLSMGLAIGETVQQVGQYAKAALGLVSPLGALIFNNDLIGKLIGTTVQKAIDLGITTSGNRNRWCGDFVASVVRQMGYTPPTGYSGVKNWYNKFVNGQDGWRLLEPGETPLPGDIAIRNKNEHIGFVESVNDDGTFNMFGGNQGGSGPGNRQITISHNRPMSSHSFGRLPAINNNQ